MMCFKNVIIRNFIINVIKQIGFQRLNLHANTPNNIIMLIIS